MDGGQHACCIGFHSGEIEGVDGQQRDGRTNSKNLRRREARSGRSAPLTECYGRVWRRIFWNLESKTEVLPEVSL